MTEQPPRFPGFSAVSQAEHWDPVTRDLVLSRLGPNPDARFFPPAPFETVVLLLEELIDQDRDLCRSLASSIDARLADTKTDGWHHENMPIDVETWRRSVDGLDEDARAELGLTFVDASKSDRHRLVAAVQKLSGDWHGLPASRLWDLWLRYACTAAYAHPDIWDELGFPGPAFPRGYKNTGIDKREPFETADVRPNNDPASDK